MLVFSLNPKQYIICTSHSCIVLDQGNHPYFLCVKIQFLETASAPITAHDFVRLDDINHLLDQI